MGPWLEVSNARGDGLHRPRPLPRLLLYGRQAKDVISMLKQLKRRRMLGYMKIL